MRLYDCIIRPSACQFIVIDSFTACQCIYPAPADTVFSFLFLPVAPMSGKTRVKITTRAVNIALACAGTRIAVFTFAEAVFLFIVRSLADIAALIACATTICITAMHMWMCFRVASTGCEHGSRYVCLFFCLRTSI